VTYRISRLPTLMTLTVVQNWRTRLEEHITKKTKRHTARAALRQVLVDVRQVDDQTLEMDLREGPEAQFRPLAILLHLTRSKPQLLAASRICRVAAQPIEDNSNVRRTYHQCQRL
jgi:hypothetical protein